MSNTETITWNGQEYDEDTFASAVAMARNSTSVGRGGLGGADVSRNPDVLRRFGEQFNGDRDIIKTLGYDNLEDDTALERYRAKYERQDIAKRIVDIYPDETWRDPPEVVDAGDDETEFESRANQLINTTLNHYWHRVDKAQRLGEFGVLVFGFDDGQALDQPVNESALNSPDDIAYVNVHPQEEVEDWQLGKETDGEHSNPEDERYNKPVEYYVDFGDVDAESVDDEFEWVHWTRVFPHVAEDNLETDLKGMPALKPVYNRLDDLQKTVGASAEMFWTGANPKYVASVRDDFALQQFSDTGAREDFKEDFQRLVHELQNYLVTAGMDIEEFGGQEVDPSGVVDNILQMISAATDIPKNKLVGNEMGERSTTQDRRNWFDSVTSRRTNFAIPTVIRPTLDRLVSYGILPDPDESDYSIEFPSLFEPTESETAEIQAQRANALSGAQLGASLPAEARMEYLETGEFPDMEQEVETPVDESDDNVIDAFSNITNERDIDFLDPDLDLTPPTSAQKKAESVLETRDNPSKSLKGFDSRVEAIADIVASGEELTPEAIDEIHQWFESQNVAASELPSLRDWWRSSAEVRERAYGGQEMAEWVADTRRKLVNMGELDALDASEDMAGNQEKTPPSQAQTNAEAVLEIREKTDAMTDTGWRRANQLADGEELSTDVIQKMAQFKRHQGNTEYENYSDIPQSKKAEDAESPWWEDNGTVAWLGWGGTAGVEWAVEQSEELTENQRYGEGDEVDTPDGLGVVVDVLTETVEGDDETVEASSDSPTYAVAVEDEGVGMGFYKASDLSSGDIDAEVPADVSEGETTENAIYNIIGWHTNNFRPPQSWRDSDTPARLIALKALSGMGGSFDGCVREMRGNVRTPDEFCGSFLDYSLGNPYWRGDSPLPGA